MAAGKKKLTIKQRKFLQVLQETYNPTEAAFQVYNCKDRLSARVRGSQVLSSLNIEFFELMDKMGLTDDRLLDKLSSKLECSRKTTNENGEVEESEDNYTQMKALELGFKLRRRLQSGTYVDNSKHLTVVVDSLHNLAETYVNDGEADTKRGVHISE